MLVAMEKFVVRKPQYPNVAQAPGRHPSSVVSRKRVRYFNEKTQDAVELPKKVRNVSRFQALEEQVGQMSQLLTSADSVGNAALLQKLESQEAELEELRKRLKDLEQGGSEHHPVVLQPLKGTQVEESASLSCSAEDVESMREAGRAGGHLGTAYGRLGGRPMSMKNTVKDSGVPKHISKTMNPQRDEPLVAHQLQFINYVRKTLAEQGLEEEAANKTFFQQLRTVQFAGKKARDLQRIWVMRETVENKT